MTEITSIFQKRVKYRLTDFDYNLPSTRIAQYPAKPRDHACMIVVHRATETIEHKRFYHIVDYLKKNDLLILNKTKVFPAKLNSVKDRTDAKVEVFLLRELENDLWEVQVRPARKVRIGNKLYFTENVYCDVIDNTISGGRVVRFDYHGEDIYSIIDRIGEAPLPAYITRSVEPQDKIRYQTVYAETLGAVAAPTAGIHFTRSLMDKIQAKGVKIKFVVLHIGLGSFRPVQVEDLTRHQMDSEYFEVPPDTAIAINEAKAKERRIIAVGSSTVRALESVVVSGFQVTAKRGWTDKFIYPPYDFKMTDMLVTNLHPPKSTQLMVACAFAERKLILRAYQEAKKKDYRFLCYGDCMMIL